MGTHTMTRTPLFFNYKWTRIGVVGFLEKSFGDRVDSAVSGDDGFLKFYLA